MDYKAFGNQVARFVGVGLASAGLDFAILQILVSVGTNPYFARLIAVIPVVTATWLANRRLTFQSQSPASVGELIRYFGISGAGLIINYSLYSILLYIGLPIWAAFIIGTGTAAVFNFMRYRILLR